MKKTIFNFFLINKMYTDKIVNILTYIQLLSQLMKGLLFIKLLIHEEQLFHLHFLVVSGQLFNSCYVW